MNLFFRPLQKLIPYRYHPTAKGIYYDLMLGVDRILGHRHGMIPPTRMNYYVGGGDFVKIGNEFFESFKKLCDLKPTDNILDVGSGIGRMAIPLTTYLDANSSYNGMDIVPYAIKWCKARISSHFPNFHFHLANIYNKQYQPSGRIRAESYRFPFSDNSFSFVFATSVFTHLLRPAAENYLNEIARTLVPGGRAFLTFFLINDETKRSIDDGASSIKFQQVLPGAWTGNPNLPEESIAFNQKDILDLFKSLGLEVTAFHPGSWSGKENSLTYQDVFILKKTNSV